MPEEASTEKNLPGRLGKVTATMQNVPLPTGNTRTLSTVVSLPCDPPYRVSHVNREYRPATPRPLGVQRVDRMFDPSPPALIPGFEAVSFSSTFSGFHCHGFGRAAVV